jgi:hypothetical protein
MMDLQATDLHKTFIVIDTRKNKNMILEYIGIDNNPPASSSSTSLKFRYCYNVNSNIYNVYYPIDCQERYMLQPIMLPFDITSMINTYLYDR